MNKLFGKLRKSAIGATVAVALIITMISAGVAVAIAAPSDAFDDFGNKSEASKYAKPDFSTITGEGSNPPELRGDASALGMEKQWYEYIAYSTTPVGQVNLSSTQRVIYYDPYDYNSCLVMRVKGDISDWSTANEVSFTYETVESHVIRTDTTTEAFTTIGEDTINGGGNTRTNDQTFETTTGWIKETGTETQTGKISEEGWDYGSEDKFSLAVTGGTSGSELTAGFTLLATDTWEKNNTTLHHKNEQKYNLTNAIDTKQTYNLTTQKGGEVTTDETTWSVAKKFEKTTGVSTTNGDDWSTSEGRSVTTTYLAQYFNEEGSPLSWKIVQYAVFMPLRYDLQTKVGSEWLTVYSGYSLITPIQGTCRAYMRNNVSYIEDWGTGLPVTWDDFWGNFFTVESLTTAYNSKLYPDTLS